jgi:hydrogenase maturation protease
MNTVYLFGIGSPFADDSIGWTAVDELENELAPVKNIVFEKLRAPASIFQHEFVESDFIIFIDAMVADEPKGIKAGSVRAFSADQLPDSSKQLSSHGLNLKTAVDLLVGLGLSHNQIKVIGIAVPMPSQIDYIQGVSCALRATTNNLSARILNLLNEFKVEYKR